MLRFYRTFSINNLTPGPRLGFPKPAFFLSGVTFRVFISYFVFPFKIKQKKVVTQNRFLKMIF